jgi:transposase-like protein
MRKKVSDEEKTTILAALTAGKSQHSIAKEFGIGKATVYRIVRNLPRVERIPLIKATEARQDYAQAARLAALNEAFDKIRQAWHVVQKPLEMQQLAMAILIDKRRLEEGEAMNRSEISPGAAHGVLAVTAAKARILGELDRLAARNGQKRLVEVAE